MIPAFVLLSLVLAFPRASAAYSAVDSLLEEAAYLFQVAGRPGEAAGIYQKVLAGFPDDPYAVEVARRRLEFLRAVLPGGHPPQARPLGGLRSGPPVPGETGEAQAADALLLWRRKFGSSSLAGAVEGGGAVAAVNSDGYLICLEKGIGGVVWARRGVNGSIPPIYASGLFYAVGSEGALLGFSPSDGALSVSARLNLTTGLSPSPADRLFAASETHALCLRPKTGEVLWSRPLSEGGRVTEAPVARGKFVLFLIGAGEAVVLEAATGRELWRSSLRPAFAPLLCDEGIAVPDRSGLSYFHLPSGKLLWKRGFSSPLVCAVQGPGDLCVTVTARGEVAGWPAGGGAARFSFPAHPGNCAADGEGIYLADNRGVVEGWSFDGRRRWAYPTGETEKVTLSLSPGCLIAAAANEGLFVINARSLSPEDGRLLKARQEVQMLLKSGMTQMASEKARRALSGLSAGDPELWGLWAVILEGNVPAGGGLAPGALEAWEKFFEYADAAHIERSGALARLRRSLGANWVAFERGTGKFAPFYLEGGDLLLLGDGEVWTLNAGDGRLRRRSRVDPEELPLQAGMLVNGKLICAGEERLYCIEFKTGRLLWRTTLSGKITDFAANNGTVLAGTWNQGAFLVNLETGRVESQVLVGAKALFPLKLNRAFFVAGLEGLLFGLKDSAVIFKKWVGDRIGAPPFACGEKIVISTSLGLLKGYSPRDGALLWEARLGAPGISFGSANGRLFALFSNAALASLDPLTGTLLWERKAGSEASEFLSAGTDWLAVPGGRGVDLYLTENGSLFKSLKFPGKVSQALIDKRALFVKLENGLIFRMDFGG